MPRHVYYVGYGLSQRKQSEGKSLEQPFYCSDKVVGLWTYTFGVLVPKLFHVMLILQWLCMKTQEKLKDLRRTAIQSKDMVEEVPSFKREKEATGKPNQGRGNGTLTMNNYVLCESETIVCANQ